MKTLTRTLIILLACGLLAAQTPINQFGLPMDRAWITRVFVDGSGNLAYRCWAQQLSTAGSSTWSIGAGLTSIVVSSNVGTVTAASHNLYPGARVVVSASGTAALNGTYVVATVTGANTFTIATSGVNDATYNAAGTTITTRWPLLNQAVWIVEVFTSLSGVYTGSYVADIGVASPLGTLTAAAKCSDRATY